MIDASVIDSLLFRRQWCGMRQQSIGTTARAAGIARIPFDYLAEAIRESVLSTSPAPVVTASIRPTLFFGRGKGSPIDPMVCAVLLMMVILAGFAFRAYDLSAEGFSEDELNKLHAVEDYRAHGLTSTNGEHPMLMKALLTVSSVAAERWNKVVAPPAAAINPTVTALPEAPSNADQAANQEASRAAGRAWYISSETWLRVPGAVFGALTSLLIFIVTAELFGRRVGLIAAALWAFDPTAIGFNRIAKEDSFLVFFFLLANVFWLRGQRFAETGRDQSAHTYYWMTAISFGLMLASKYLPHLLFISFSYYHIFQALPATRWRLGKPRLMFFFLIMGAAFLLCNPTILLPSTWHEIRIFAGERRIGHDGYEFMNHLYPNQMTLWLRGSPWYFYYAFMLFKLPVPVVIAFLGGLPQLFRRRLGDGRFFVLFWLFFWFFPFTLFGGKFTRYFTIALPAVLITAAIGVQWAIAALTHYLARHGENSSSSNKRRRWRSAFGLRFILPVFVVALLIGASIVATLGAAPYYRLYTNVLGGGRGRAGTYFPHDEFYDARVREAAAVVAQMAGPGARVASETPGLFSHYAQLAGRNDLIAVSLSNINEMGQLVPGDYIILARGRRYFSNDWIFTMLQALPPGTHTVLLRMGDIPAVNIVPLDDEIYTWLHSALNSR